MTETLKAKRGKPRDQQIRDLRKVCDFAHRFFDTQTELSKLIQKINYTQDGKDTELQHAFVIKLSPSTQAEIISGEFNTENLQAIVDTAQRYELHHPPNTDSWKVSHAVIDLRQINRTSPPSNRPSGFQPCSFCRKTNHLSKDCFFKPQTSRQPPQSQASFLYCLKAASIFALLATRGVAKLLTTPPPSLKPSNCLFILPQLLHQMTNLNMIKN